MKASRSAVPKSDGLDGSSTPAAYQIAAASHLWDHHQAVVPKNNQPRFFPPTIGPACVSLAYAYVAKN